MHKMVVMAKAAPGRVEELARWYDERHIPDLLAVPGFVRAERHGVIPVKQPAGTIQWDFIDDAIRLTRLIEVIEVIEVIERASLSGRQQL